MESMAQRRFRIAVDTGGTFTDTVLGTSDGKVAAGKALTTYGRVSHGFIASLDRAAQDLGLSADSVLREADVIVYGTTHATNAVLTGNAATTALLTTAGVRDTLTLREGGRREVFDSRAAYPSPYVPRRLTFGITERIDAQGIVVRALDENLAREVIASLPGLDVESIAVMLLWSIVNPTHERPGEFSVPDNGDRPLDHVIEVDSEDAILPGREELDEVEEVRGEEL